MKRARGVILAGALVLLSSVPALAYDAAMAKKADGFFSRMDRQTLTTSPCKVNPDVVLKWIKEGQKVTLVDIRTPEEAGIMSVTLKGSLRVPFNEVFRTENLDKLPKDGKIVIVCHSGFRAGSATAFLQFIGVNNVVALNGGIQELARVLTPFTAP
jgi:rhodanese-related sulfurtransferase